MVPYPTVPSNLILLGSSDSDLTVSIQWSLYYKTTHETKKMWSYIAGGLKIKVI